MRTVEHDLQVACINYFRMQYREYASMMFAIPNGAKRSARTGAYYKAEGLMAGVADVILLLNNDRHNALCLEFKTKTGKQSESQKAWQAEAEKYNCRYEVVRTFDEFKDIIDDYLK